MINLIKKILSQNSAKFAKRSDEERIKFSAEVKTQLLKLKEKGLSIPVFTL
jgi:hypothetical protein